ncbi:MAG: hypothetical protein ACFFDW_15710 [Candidatus Thorarchaeota archaeon]
MSQDEEKTDIFFQNNHIKDINQKKVKKPNYEFIALAIPFVILFVFMFYFYYYKAYSNPLFFYNLVETLTFPELLWSYLVKVVLMVVTGIPIGFFSRKKAAYIHYGFYSVIIWLFRFFMGYSKFSDYNSISFILYTIFDSLILIGLLFLGVMIGKLFGKDYWVDEKIANQLEIH